MKTGKELKVGSLFTGIGGFDQGFKEAGMQIVWQCEIEESCQMILRRHFKGEIYNNVTTINPSKLAPVDVLCGGFPCQDLSVAGLREGLAGKRSGLWHEFHRIIKSLSPRWVVIENVPGLLSSNGGEDFAVILQGLVECGYGVAWRILDAQYFGVAQRRRRVFIVGSLGDGSCAEILFEREGLQRNPAEGRQKGQGVAAPIPRSFASHHGRTAGNNCGVFNMIVEGFDKGRAVHTGDISAPLRVNGAIKEGVNGGKPDNQCVLIAANNVGERDVSTALSSSNERIDGDTETFIVYAVRPSAGRTLWDGADNLVAWHENKQGELSPSDIAKSLRASASHSYQGVGVRRLTPRECERLQGFDDDWTLHDADGKVISDSARYRMLGNAVARTCARWIGKRIVDFEDK